MCLAQRHSAGTGYVQTDTSVALHQGLHCLIRTELQHFSAILTCSPLIHKIDNSIFIVSICME